MARFESDSLGVLEVPDEAYYGVQTLRALENFPITGQRIHPAFIHALGDVKAACLAANQAIGHIPKELADPLIQAASELAKGQWDQQIVVDPIQGGAGTSLNMNVNEVITNRALEILGHPKGSYHIIHPNVHANMAQSTNDVIPTAFRIALLRVMDRSMVSLRGLVEALDAKGQEMSGVLKMGRTHLQDAVPIRMGQEFAAYAAVIRRDIERIQQAQQGLYAVNIGATAVGTGLNADPEYIELVIASLRKKSQFPLRRADDLVDATQNIDALVHTSGALKTCAVNLTKIANDLRLMASGPKAGFGEVRLPARQPGSSIMPGKVNPVMPELINQVAFRIMGNDHTVTLAAQAGQLELNVMQPVLFDALLQSVDVLTNAVDVFTRLCITGIEANAEYTHELAERSPSLATALNPYIGYTAAAEIAKESLATGRSVRELVLERGLLDEDTLDRVLDPEALTEPRALELGTPGVTTQSVL